MRSSEFMRRYFPDHTEYDADGIMGGDILPLGTFRHSLSNDFLNGFLNYVTPVQAFVINRHSSLDEELERYDAVSYQEPAGSYKWVPLPDGITKREALALLTAPGRSYHPRLDVFRDDVLLLARAPREEEGTVGTTYVVFWFDLAARPGIGRFRTEDPENIVVALFDAWVKQCNDDNLGYEHKGQEAMPLPLHYLTAGWRRF